MAIIDSAYQYYLSTYGTSNVSRYDTHKKSQLRDTYNRMVKINKDSPLYRIKNINEANCYAIDIKECTRNIQNIAASLSAQGHGIEYAFSSKIAQSSDENVIIAEYIGAKDDLNDHSFAILVEKIAKQQVNTGNFLTPNKLDFSVGSYSFDLNTNINCYEFQFTVNPKDTNRTVLQKISRLMNDSKINIVSDLIENKQGELALSITSKQTGIAENEDYLFQILPSANSASVHAMRTLGINQTTQEAQNASFLLNGESYTSSSNIFTIDNAFHVTLTGISPNNTATTVSFKTNADAVTDNVERLVNSYNKVIQVAHSYTPNQNFNRLISDISSVAKNCYNELEPLGLSLDEERYLHIDHNLLAEAISAEDAQDNFVILNNFKNALNTCAYNISLNPMHYVDKVLVFYKNPGHNFVCPYVTSLYCGFLLDEYC